MERSGVDPKSFDFNDTSSDNIEPLEESNIDDETNEIEQSDKISEQEEKPETNLEVRVRLFINCF